MTANDLRTAIADRTANVGIVGAGYVGLPLALSFAKAGYRVKVVDVNADRVRRLCAGDSYIQDVSSEALSAQVKAGRLDATTDYATLSDADIIFVAVPTPFDRAKQPDLRYIVQSAESIAAVLRKGQLIVLESTTYPGTTDEIMRPILERAGLRAGVDFYLAFSPERIDPGNKTYTIENTPKVVGGVDAESTALATAILQVVTDGHVHPVSSARVAELTKLLENTFRAVNIALVNELAMLCDRMQIDIWEVIEAAATKPYGFMPFYPGPGVGGHCIPIDPYYLAWKAREFDFHTKFIELAAETNLAMPFFTVGRIRKLLNDAGRSLRGSRILALGASFKKDIDDARESAAIRVMEILNSEGAILEYHDPFVPVVKLTAPLFASAGDHLMMRSVPLDVERLRAADCVVILVAHSSVDYGAVLREAPRVFDAVNATRGNKGRGEVERL
ncbi:MAG: nucleotide sugar dehydrogenase [Chloroflexota bacterium]